MQFQQTRPKRLTLYTIKLSKQEYDEEGPKIKEALKKFKQYYDRFDLQYEYEIQALRPSDNILQIKAFIYYNKKLTSGTSLSEL